VVSGGLRERLLQEWLHLDADRRPDSSRAVTLAAQGATSVEPYVARYLPALAAATAVPTLVLGVLLVVDWPSALIVALTLPLLPLFAALIGASTRDATRQRWSALSSLSGHFLDVVRGLPTLVSYGRAERQVQSIADVSQRHRRATMQTLRVAFLSSAAMELLATVSVAMVAVAAGLRLAQGSMALPTALTAILLAPEAYWPIRRVGAEFHAAADGAAALADIRREIAAAALPAQRTDAAPARHTVTASVRVREATYAYPGSDRLVLDAVSLRAGPGLTVITGPSGTGKTTLLELVAGLRLPQSGDVGCSPAHLVSQRAFLTTGSLRANLSLGTGATSEQMWQALRSLGLDGVVAALPEGLDTAIGDDGFGLSAGQRARLVLARAVLSHASVILLDEPTAHLDEASAELAHAAIRALADRGCVLAVTHRPQLVAMADVHVHLDRGRTTSLTPAS